LGMYSADTDAAVGSWFLLEVYIAEEHLIIGAVPVHIATFGIIYIPNEECFGVVYFASM